jgi:hypothetical protein
MIVTSRSVDVGRLKILAEKANREHSQAQMAAQQAVKHAVEAGDLLLKVKETVGHGGFTKWIEENFKGTPRHARRYMRLAKAADQNRIDPDEVSSLTEAENMLRDQDAEETPTPTNFRRGLRDDEYEPEVEGEEYEFDNEEEYKKFFGEYGPEDRDEEHETEPMPQDVARKPARKRDLETSAFTAINRFIHEVPGEEKDRIQATRERLDMEESALLALASEEGQR